VVAEDMEAIGWLWRTRRLRISRGLWRLGLERRWPRLGLYYASLPFYYSAYLGGRVRLNYAE